MASTLVMKAHDLLDKLRAGERRALARAITLVESTRADHRHEAQKLLDKDTEAVLYLYKKCQAEVLSAEGKVEEAEKN